MTMTNADTVVEASGKAQRRGGFFLSILQETYREFSADDCSRVAAALAFYAIFSIAPLLVIVLSIVSAIWSDNSISSELVSTMSDVVGPEGASLLQTMMDQSASLEKGLFASGMGLLALAFGSSKLFFELQNALNKIWHCSSKSAGGLAMIRQRATSFAMVLIIGFLLIVSLSVQAGIAAFLNVLGQFLLLPPFVLQILNSLLLLGFATLLFGMIFMVLPDRKLRWKDISVGAFFTAILFSIGQWCIGYYLGNATVASSYGVAGSLAVLLIWIYYSSLLLLLGAEFTEVYSRRRKKLRDEKPQDISPRKATTTLRNDEPREQVSMQQSLVSSVSSSFESKGAILNPSAWLRHQPLLTLGTFLGVGALCGKQLVERSSSKSERKENSSSHAKQQPSSDTESESYIFPLLLAGLSRAAVEFGKDIVQDAYQNSSKPKAVLDSERRGDI